LLHTAPRVHLTLLSYILNLASLICLAVQNTQIDGKLDRKPTYRHASAAIFQVHDRCFTPPLSEFEHIKMRNATMAHLKTACGPPVGNHWSTQSCRGKRLAHLHVIFGFFRAY